MSAGCEIYLSKRTVIELFLHRDYRTSRIVSAFVVGDCDDEAKAQRKELLVPTEQIALK